MESQVQVPRRSGSGGKLIRGSISGSNRAANVRNHLAQPCGFQARPPEKPHQYGDL
jgi:hypothetical protein